MRLVRCGDVDVILAAHGAGPASVANTTMKLLAQRLEHANPGLRVAAAFRLGEPTYRMALDCADRHTCVIVPMLTSDGYYAAALRRDVHESSRPSRPIVLPPVGADPAFAEALSSRIESILQASSFERRHTQVVVVGHGTVRHAQSRAATESVARRIEATTRLTVRAAFLDDEPCVEAVIAAIPRSDAIVVVPFLLGGGRHGQLDVPSRVRAAAEVGAVSPDRIVVLESLGALPELYEVIEGAIRRLMSVR